MSKGIGGSTAEAELASLGPWPSPAPAITAEERAQRLAKAQSILANLNADAIIVGAGASLRYFTGVGWNATERPASGPFGPVRVPATVAGSLKSPEPAPPSTSCVRFCCQTTDTGVAVIVPAGLLAEAPTVSVPVVVPE